MRNVQGQGRGQLWTAKKERNEQKCQWGDVRRVGWKGTMGWRVGGVRGSAGVGVWGVRGMCVWGGRGGASGVRRW